MDVISDILTTDRLAARVYHNAQYCGNWVRPGLQTPHGSMQLILHGHCYLHLADDLPPRLLQHGDVLILPRFIPHRLSFPMDAPTEKKSVSYDFAQGILPDSTGLLSAKLVNHNDYANPLLEDLPEVLIMQYDPNIHSWFKPWKALLDRDTPEQQHGAVAMLNRLADTLFIQVLRDYVMRGGNKQGIFAALADEQINRALTMLHSYPERDWDLVSLGEEAWLPPQQFVEQFEAILDCSPLEYLANWRKRVIR